MAEKEKEVKSVLEPIISKINTNREAQALVNKWIDGKYGKIVGWKIKTDDWEENYHVIFTSDDVWLNVGEYPAFDIMFIGDTDTVLDILRGEKSINAELKQRKVMVWGNLNEGILLKKVLRKIREM